jgi:putative redox protein
MGLAGCTGMDVVSILEKKRQQVTDFEVEVRGEKSAEPPFHLPRIELVFRVWGDVSPDALVRAVELSQDKYCTVSNTMKSTAEIVYSFEINPSRS